MGAPCCSPPPAPRWVLCCQGGSTHRLWVPFEGQSCGAGEGGGRTAGRIGRQRGKEDGGMKRRRMEGGRGGRWGHYLRQTSDLQVEADDEGVPADPQHQPHRVLPRREPVRACHSKQISPGPSPLHPAHWIPPDPQGFGFGYGRGPGAEPSPRGDDAAPGHGDRHLRWYLPS